MSVIRITTILQGKMKEESEKHEEQNVICEEGKIHTSWQDMYKVTTIFVVQKCGIAGWTNNAFKAVQSSFYRP